MNSFRATAGTFFRATGRALFVFFFKRFSLARIYFFVLYILIKKKKSVVGYRPRLFCLFLWISTFLDPPQSK